MNYYKKFINGEFTARQLWNLRNQIKLNSLYHKDYHNTYGIKAEDAAAFFDGYFSYITEIAMENTGGEPTFDDVIRQDCKENLFAWYGCSDDYSWVRRESEDTSISIHRK